MTYETLYAWPGGRTSRGDFMKALVPLFLAAAFYFFLTHTGRNGEWVLTTLLFPGFMLHARRLHDMGQTAWLLLAPALLDASGAWLHFFTPKSELLTPVGLAAIVVSAGFLIWGLVGKGQASANRFGEAAAA